MFRAALRLHPVESIAITIGRTNTGPEAAARTARYAALDDMADSLTVAVTSTERSPVLPNVPTMTEVGVKTAVVDLRFWFGIFAPTGVPAAVRAKLEKAVSATLSNPHVRERLAHLDIEPAYAPGNALKAKLESEIANWSKFVDAHGIKPE